MARMYREASEKLGHRPMSDKDWDVLDQEAKSLEIRYGKEFSTVWMGCPSWVKLNQFQILNGRFLEACPY
jgi:hypothetical protein